MIDELEAFHHTLGQDVHLAADAEGHFLEDAFFEYFTEHLVEAGEIETADRAFYTSPRGLRVDGYGGSPAQADGTLTLLLCDFVQGNTVETLTATELDATLKRARSFLVKSRDPVFRSGLEESSPGFGLADLITASWQGLRRVRIVLMSNRVLSSRVDGRDSEELDGIPIAYSVWDLGRLSRYLSSGKAREDIVVEMADHGGPVLALSAHLSEADYEAYLLVMPGVQLASIYGRWGARLLEQNVRVFLQARGGVNKGIRNTIDNSPEMFFAYNNGLTATAEGVELEEQEGGRSIVRIRNLQIVNGGQTTASIYAASNKGDGALRRVFVQVKLSIIPPAKAEEVVPRISEYANSQNRVNAADFFANHPYHVRLKEFSETVYAPSPEGSFRESKWFYERARGQYQDARSRLSVAECRKYDLEFPKTQVFAKTDLAKFITVWDEQPHIVSKGAQKNFAVFAEAIGKAWTDNPDSFNEVYFKHVIAKAIVFRRTEALVTAQEWYAGGYRANIVAYAIAKVACDIRRLGRSLDFDRIWATQGASPMLCEVLVLAAARAHEILTAPPETAANVTEWAKQQACWNRLSDSLIGYPKAFVEELATLGERAASAKGAQRAQKVLNGIQAQKAVVEAGGTFWLRVRTWGAERKVLSEKELGILSVAQDIPNRVPSDKQSQVLMKALERLRNEGFPERLGD